MRIAPAETRVLSGFEERADAWLRTLERDAADTVFMAPEYQRAWWSAFGRGRRLLVAAEREDEIAALAPLFADQGMVFFVGSGGSDYLDFVGDTSDASVLDGLLETARDEAPGFVGFRFYHVPDRSPTGARLAAAAERLGLRCVDEGAIPAPRLDLTDSDAALAARSKKSLRRHAGWFRQNGRLEVEHLTRAAAILPWLDPFFDQHVARWAGTSSPSLFVDPAQRRFYRELVQEADGAGWLRFTCVRWDDRPIAFHLGFHHAGRWLWYKPSFDVELARRSPGEVLLAALLDRATEESARTFDFGLGDEPFKRRFATGVETVRTWGLYPA
jgi:CelD/BcsL family acetyltransferase involved in cellulose biosynthesis